MQSDWLGSGESGSERQGEKRFSRREALKRIAAVSASGGLAAHMFAVGDRRDSISSANAQTQGEGFMTSATRKPMTEWYYPDGIRMPKGTTPATAVHGVTAKAVEWLVLANLAPREISVTLTYFFEEGEPIQKVLTVPPRWRRTFMPGPDLIPDGKLYGVRLASDHPFLPQPTRGETEEVKPPLFPGNSNMSFVAYPGPLGQKETRWVYADGIVIHKDRGWADHEWITILNPTPGREARIRITFNYEADQRSYSLVVPAERVRTIDLHRLLPTDTGFFPIVSSDTPVVVEQVRRPVIVANPAPRGGFASLAFPIGDMELDESVVTGRGETLPIS